MFYHGSSVKGLTTLLPYLSEHGKPYIYFSSNPVVASFYMIHVVKKPYNWFPFGFDPSGVPVYTEYYPDALRDVYGGKTGYLYKCNQVDSAENPTSINCAYVCEKPVPVIECTEYTDIFKSHLESEKEGRLIIRRYETLGQKTLSFVESAMQAEIQKYRLKDNPDTDYSLFLKEHFPGIWSRAK